MAPCSPPGEIPGQSTTPQMLLPADLREWVPADDLMHFVLEAVEAMPLSTLKVNRRGSGSAQYPPQIDVGVVDLLLQPGGVR